MLIAHFAKVLPGELVPTLDNLATNLHALVIICITVAAVPSGLGGAISDESNIPLTVERVRLEARWIPDGTCCVDTSTVRCWR